jgi:hypothetical protein
MELTSLETQLSPKALMASRVNKPLFTTMKLTLSTA